MAHQGQSRSSSHTGTAIDRGLNITDSLSSCTPRGIAAAAGYWLRRRDDALTSTGSQSHGASSLLPVTNPVSPSPSAGVSESGMSTSLSQSIRLTQAVSRRRPPRRPEAERWLGLVEGAGGLAGSGRDGVGAGAGGTSFMRVRSPRPVRVCRFPRNAVRYTCTAPGGAAAPPARTWAYAPPKRASGVYWGGWGCGNAAGTRRRRACARSHFVCARACERAHKHACTGGPVRRMQRAGRCAHILYANTARARARVISA